MWSYNSKALYRIRQTLPCQINKKLYVTCIARWTKDNGTRSSAYWTDTSALFRLPSFVL